MSKTFDTIQRGYLFDDLKQILNPDELCLIHLLLDNVEIAVKLENELGELYKSLIGSLQGDAVSALFFIIYLATILRKSKIQIENKENSIVPHLQDHNYAKSNSRQHQEEYNYSKKTPENTTFTVDQQYADDISWASTSLTTLETIESIVPAELKARNLYVNESKTEKYSISRNSNDNWKSGKLVGSKLDTECDIKHRKTGKPRISKTETNPTKSKNINNRQTKNFRSVTGKYLPIQLRVMGPNAQEAHIDVYQRHST